MYSKKVKRERLGEWNGGGGVMQCRLAGGGEVYGVVYEEEKKKKVNSERSDCYGVRGV